MDLTRKYVKLKGSDKEVWIQGTLEDNLSGGAGVLAAMMYLYSVAGNKSAKVWYAKVDGLATILSEDDLDLATAHD